MASARSAWLADVGLYTLGGAVSATLVGAGLGALGGLLPAAVADRAATILVVVAVLALVREVSVPWFPWLPLVEPKRQTEDRWAKNFPGRIAATLWGFDLGLTVSTRFTFAGTWVLLLLPILTADVALGAVVLLAHWFGRALPVWLGPLFMASPASTPRVFDAIDASERLFRAAQVLGLAMLIAFWFVQ